MLVLKLLGFNVIDIMINTYYFKMYMYIMYSLIILHLILNLYLLHRFYTKAVKIPEFLPEFVINWLKLFEEMSSNKESVKYFKNMFYLEIGLYTLIIIIVTLIF